ncbi:MAG: glutamine synthetase family protein, partial [SAR202 cluster bacterium]|nr:glutamine synthetase family protein [SAR202 cluster bacterium]
FYVFDNSYQEAKEKSYIELNPSNRFREDYSLLNTSSEEALMAKLRNTLSNSGIEVECTKGEWDLGQQEINVKYSDPLDMADKHVIIKQAAKELAYQNDMSITFMSKWNEKSAGSSMHIHLSLWDLDDSKNLFYDKTVKSDLKSSNHFQWFLGGWMKYTPDIFMFYSPYSASFKRFVSESFAPTKISWSLDNRTSTFRIVGEQNNLRIECRIPGADANPYLAFAASIAAGINGIENKISPPEITKGDSYTNTSLISCPGNIDKGLKYFSESKFISDHFNQEIKDHYLHFFKTEKFAFERIITDWEKNRYFERI